MISTETGIAYPGFAPRLTATLATGDAAAYKASGGYAPLENPLILLDHVEMARITGRGGASFPLARKLRSVREGEGQSVVVANGEEGEPMSMKDRWLLRERPHLVIDGLRLAGLITGASQGYIYLSDPVAAVIVRDCLAEASSTTDLGLDIKIVQVDRAYVAGEETAAVQAINGGPALPKDKPPRPYQQGVAGKPTAVNNVETLACLAALHRLGIDEYLQIGTPASPGSFLLTLTTPRSQGLYEIPFGTTLDDVLAWLDEDHDIQSVLMGGYFGGLATKRVLHLPLGPYELAAAGTSLGCGAIAVLDGTKCPISVVAAVLTYFARINARQCGACVNGTKGMSTLAQALRKQTAQPSDVERLQKWSQDLRGRGACGTLDGATNVAASLLREFPEIVAAHLYGHCPKCINEGQPDDVPFAAAITTHRPIGITTGVTTS